MRFGITLASVLLSSTAAIANPVGNIFTSGGAVTLDAMAGASGSYSLTDLNGASVGGGAVSPGRPVALGALRDGFYTFTSGTATATLAVMPPATINPQFGVNTHVAASKNPDIAYPLARLGIGVVRDLSAWNVVERTKGVYTYQPAVDAYRTILADLGMKLQLVAAFGNPLYWNGVHAKWPFEMEPLGGASSAAFGAYAGALAQHDALPEMGVYNEWNGTFCTQQPGSDDACDAAHYVHNVLVPAAKAIRVASPGTKILGGARIGLATPGGVNHAIDWFQAMNAAGAWTACNGPCLDELDIHPYTNTNGPMQLEGQAAALRAAMKTATGRDLPVVVTEFSSFIKDYKVHAQYAVQAATMFLADGVAEWDLYQAVDDPSWAPCIGLFHMVSKGVWEINPMGYAYAEAAQMLNGAKFAGREDDGSTYRVYKFVRPDNRTVRVAWATSNPVSHATAGAVTDMGGRPNSGRTLTTMPVFSIQ